MQPVIDYGSSEWGINGYSCVKTVQYRACRYFLGLEKYAPTPAVSGDMGLLSTLTQTMALCNENLAQGVSHGQLLSN